MYDRVTSNVLFYLLILFYSWYLSTKSTLLCVLYKKAIALCTCRFDTYDIAFASTLIISLSITHTHTHTHTHTQHTGTNRLTHKYILTPPVMCSRQLSLLHLINLLLILKGYFTEVDNIFTFQELLTCSSHTLLSPD